MDDNISDIKRSSSIYSNLSSNPRKIGLLVIALLVLILVIVFAVKYFGPEPDAKVVPAFDLMLSAIETNNIAACSELTPAKKQVCEDTILGNLLENVAPKKSSADELINLAAESGNVSYCEQIISVAAKELCLSQINKKQVSQSQTQIITDDNSEVLEVGPSDNEVIKSAVVSSDSTECNKITNPVKRDLCFYQFNR